MVRAREVLPALPLEATSSSLAALYETHGHLILENLPPASLLTLDGISLTVSGPSPSAQETKSDSEVVKRFRGFKLVPAGWHSVVVTPASDAGSHGESPTLGAMEGMALRSILLVHVEAKEVINRRYDEEVGCLVPMGSPLGGLEAASSHALTAGLIAALDRDLTPYPLRSAQYGDWSSFARPWYKNVTLTHKVAKGMLGDALTADVLDPVIGGGLEDQQRGKGRRGQSNEERKLEEELLKAAKRTEKGQESLSGTSGSGPSQSGDAGKRIRLADFSLLRSWPEGALAAERTRWSRDKSWALHKALETWTDWLLSERDALPGKGSATDAIVDPNAEAHQAFLLSFHLLFHLFVSLGSEDLLLAWRNHISLICQSASAIGSHGDAFGAHPSEVDTSAGEEDRALLQPELHARFLQLLQLQLSLLGKEWFAEGAQEVEDAIKIDLKTLRGHMSRAMALDAREKERGVDEDKQGDGSRKSAAADSEDEEISVVRRSSKSSSVARGKRLGVAAQPFASKAPRQKVSPAAVTAARPRKARQDFESLLSSWRSLSSSATVCLGWQLDEQTDEEAEVEEELDEEHDEAVRRAMEEMAEEERRQAVEGSEASQGMKEQDSDGTDDYDGLDESIIQY